MLVVPLLIFGVFFVLPSTLGYFYAFTNWSAYSQDLSFVGIQNFIDVMKEKTVPTAFVNTLIFGILKTVIVTILVYGAMYLPFSSMVFGSFIKGLPRELDEAAVMDGCQGTKLYVQIIMPLLKPVIATTAVLNFMWIWNDLQTPLYLLNSSDKWTMPLSVYNFYGQFNQSWNLVCADMVLVFIPVVLLYIFAQKYVVFGMTAGAVKG